MHSTIKNTYSCLMLDRDCEIFEVLHPHADMVYDHFGYLDIPDNALVVVGRVQTLYNVDLLRKLVQEKRATFVFCNAAEGSSTIAWHMDEMRFGDLARSGQILVVTGGELPAGYLNLTYQDFLIRVFGFKTNLCARSYFANIYEERNKPYQFLFYNGRARPHRKFLLEKLQRLGLLERSIWSCLDGRAFPNCWINCMHDGQDLLAECRPVQFVPPQYEIRQHESRVGQLPPDGNPFAKYHLFNGAWSDGELVPMAYWDSYFSLVTETGFEERETFFTEKIWKPILIGHPWIAVSNAGFYRNIRNLGFKTFDGIIDESFDRIDCNQTRIERILKVVVDLCGQDLNSFLREAKGICRYNQEHIFELCTRHIRDWPEQFFNFAKEHKRV